MNQQGINEKKQIKQTVKLLVRDENGAKYRVLKKSLCEIFCVDFRLKLAKPQ